ncbi:MAG TPA: hypothetical protein VJR26_02180 [Candidatus Acidoferrales bacterium]|nr:hypothetical protein [Candidatus Acidoferrales bacterium]
MTRCLNCGAERARDVCDSCGLPSATAELLLRKRLLNRTAVFLLGAIAFVAASGRYPALELDGILIFIGVLFFLTLALAIWVERRALRHQEVEAMKRVYYGLVPVPWLLALVLLANGAFDNAHPQVERTRVIGKFSMPGPLPIHRLIVASWRDDHSIERLAVTRDDFDRFNTGDSVIVRIGGGLIGIPWVAGVSSR